MTRHLALPAVLLLAPVAAAQIPAPYDRPPGYSATWGPRPGLPPIRPPYGHWRPGGFGLGFGLGGYAPYYGVAAPLWGGYYGGGGMTTVVIENNPPAAAPLPPAPPIDPVYLSSALGARRAAATAATATITTGVTLTLPAGGEVWVNGVKQPGSGPAFDLAVTTAAPGESVRFAITARWQAGGQTFEYERALALAAGEKQSLTVARGTAVK